jgi:hypothetical protein
MANTKLFKTNKPINPKQHIWSNIDIPIGTYVEQVNDTKNIINPMNGITVKVQGFMPTNIPKFVLKPYPWNLL